MAEFTANAIQLVNANSAVVFTDTRVDCCDLIAHRNNSSVIKLCPINGKCYTRFKVTFSGNIAVPSTGTAPITIGVALAIDGEPDGATTAVVVPADEENYFNVSTSAYIYVRHNCCSTLSVRNISTIPINVANANIIVTRE